MYKQVPPTLDRDPMRAKLQIRKNWEISYKLKCPLVGLILVYKTSNVSYAKFSTKIGIPLELVDDFHR